MSRPLDPPLVDARGQRCPLPVIALAREARDRPAGSTITLLADDPAARSDVPAWARLKGHRVEMRTREVGLPGEHTAYLVVLGGPGARS